MPLGSDLMSAGDNLEEVIFCTHSSGKFLIPKGLFISTSRCIMCLKSDGEEKSNVESTWLFIKLMIDSGNSYSGRIYYGRFLVFTVFKLFTFIGKSYFFAHYSGTPSYSPVSLFFLMRTPPSNMTGFPY